MASAEMRNQCELTLLMVIHVSELDQTGPIVSPSHREKKASFGFVCCVSAAENWRKLLSGEIINLLNTNKQIGR